jgi:DNA-directed RNA polymerase specialized sigma24 family protein
VSKVTDSVTRWIADLSAGDEAAANQIFSQFFQKTVRLARRNLATSRRRVADEEDVALEAMASFFRRVADGQFSDLEDRCGLWRLLSTITIRKAAAQTRRERRLKRGQGMVRGESVFLSADGRSRSQGLANMAGSDLTPDQVASLADNCARLLDQLPDEMLRTIAIYRLQGLTPQEIAKRIDRAEATVTRKLRRIREIWIQELTDERH